MNKLSQTIIAGGGIATLILGGGIALMSQPATKSSQDTQPITIETQNTDHIENTRSHSQPVEEKQPVIETKTETTTKSLPFETKYVDDNTLAQGTTKTTQNGVEGVETTTYSITYTDGVETAREVEKVEVTRQPVNKIIARGTYVAPKPATTTTTTSKSASQNCANGTYVNSAGNTVCRPTQSSSRPAGATARCKDGSYSYSQSRRGTCSRHGGVAQWY